MPEQPISRTARSVTPDELATHGAQLLNDGFRLALVAAHDDGPQLRVVYLFLNGQPDRRVELTVTLPSGNPTIPSLAALSYPASRFERELHDLFGIVPAGHPMPRRLVRHAHWPAGWHPLRSGADRWQKRLTDAPALLDILHRHGVELVLHGHDHRHSLMWFDGPKRPFPAVGVPSASAGSLSRRDPAAYNLFFIDNDNGWRIAMATRGLRRAASAADQRIVELSERRVLRPD